MRLLHVGLVVGLVACGSAGAQDGQEGPLDPGPTQPPTPAEEPRDAPIPAEDGAIPGIPPEADTGLVWTEPPVPIPDASPMVDAAPPPDSDAELPDAAAQSHDRFSSLRRTVFRVVISSAQRVGSIGTKHSRGIHDGWGASELKGKS